ncbi:glycosyltransferase [Arthrobacter sp. UYEF21]|uniref:glycosyltransferase n=1 Tax=Arthrobacter sp. UYEF21 TaxID=1756364 RepID=UPI003397D9FA
MNEIKPPAVTMIVSHLAPVFGMERVALNVLLLLRKSYDVDVVCVGGGAEDVAVSPGVRLLGKPLRGLGRFRSLWRMYRLARTLETETVILVGAWVAVPWLLVNGVSRWRTVVWEHSMMKTRIRHSQQLRALALAAQFLYRSAHKVVTVSRPLQRDMQSLCKQASIVTIPNPIGFPNDAGVPGRSEMIPADGFPAARTIRLLSVGSLTKVKAQHLIVRALSFLDDSFELVFIGTGPMKEELSRLADELGVSSRVIFDGYLSPDEVAIRMSDADLLIHSSVVETFGLVYVEAANAGLPVISTRNPLAEELIPAYVPGWVCEPDPESLALEIALRVREVLHVLVIQRADALRRSEFSSDKVLALWASIIQPPPIPLASKC